MYSVIEKRSKVNGELIDSWGDDIRPHLSECTASNKRIYCIGSVGGEDSFLILSHDLKLGEIVKAFHCYQILYHDGYIYALRRDINNNNLYIVEKRSSTDFSLVKKYELHSERVPVMSLNPYTGDLWVLCHKSNTEDLVDGVIEILNTNLIRKKRITLHDSHLKDIDFDENGYAYLLASGKIIKYDRKGDLDSSIELEPFCNSMEYSRIVYLKDHMYVVGVEYLEDRSAVVLYVFSKDLKLLEKKIIAEYYKELGHIPLSDREWIVSDGEKLYIGVVVGEKDEKIRLLYLYAVSPLVEVVGVEESRRVEAPVLRVDLAFVSLGDITALLKQPVSGLISGYSCVDSMRFKTKLIDHTAPKGFEGEWSCCLLGCGGWGCAYLCTRGESEVVFKVPRGFEAVIERSREPPTVSFKDLEKIKTDAEIISKLEHPNIIKLLGYSERVPILVYEFANYGSLYWQLSRGWKPSLKDVLLVVIQLGDALRYIHSRGLIHGDIKPSNVFIKDKIIKLGDFSSIVKLLSSVSLSRMMYTVGFRAPEQVYSDIKKRARELGVENRIDVYQLANIILYLLTRESIDGEEAVDERVVREKVGFIEERDLKTVLTKALAVEPEKRPSAEEFVKMFYTIYKKLKI